MSQIPNQTFATKLFFFRPAKAICSISINFHGFPDVAQLWGSQTDRADLTGTHTPEFRVLNLLLWPRLTPSFPPFPHPQSYDVGNLYHRIPRLDPFCLSAKCFLTISQNLFPFHRPALTLCHATFASFSSPTITHTSSRSYSICKFKRHRGSGKLKRTDHFSYSSFLLSVKHFAWMKFNLSNPTFYTGEVWI